MLINYTVLFSFLLQLTTAFLALRLMKKTGKHLAWGFIVIAILLQASRLVFTLTGLISGEIIASQVAVSEWMELVISVFMLIGVAGIGSFFKKRAGSIQDHSHKTEESLVQNELKYRNIFENLHDVYYEVSTEGKVLEVSPSIETLSKGQYNPCDVIGKSIFSFYANIEDRETFLSAIYQFGKVEDFELLIKNADGTTIQCAITAKLCFDKTNHPEKIVGRIHDISDRIKAREELLTNQTRFQQVAKCARVWIWEVDANGMYTYVSNSEETILGYKTEDVIGKKFFYDFFPTEVKEELKKTAFGTFSRKLAFNNFENSNIDVNGNVVILETSGVPILDNANNLIGYRGADIDITERRKSEQIFRASENKYRRLIDNSPDIVYIFSTKRGGIFYSPGVTRILGYSIDHFSENPFLWNESIYPDDFERVKNAIIESSEGLSFAVEYRIKNAFNEWIWLFDRSIEITSLAGEILIEGLATDITKRKMAEQALKQSKEYSENLIQTANVMIVGLDIDGNVNVFNEAAEKISGYCLADLDGKNWFEVLVPRDHYPIVWNEFMHITQNGKVPREFENPILTKRGEERIISWQNSVLIENGKICGTISFGNDITGRKMAEEALITSEQRYHDLFNQTNEGLLIMTLDGQLSELNQAFADMHGYTVDELKNYDIRKLDVLGEKTLNDRADQINRILAGEVLRFDVEHYHKDGHIFPLSVTTSLGSISGQLFFLAFHQDITERKLAEHAIRISEEKYRNLSENLREMIYRADPVTTRATYINKAVEVIYGYTVEEWLNDPMLWINSIHPEDRESVFLESAEAQKKLEMAVLTYRIIRKDKAIRWVEDHISWEKDQHGNVFSINGLMFDFTDRKQAEEKIREKDILFRKLSANVPDLIFQFTRKPDGNYFVPIASEGIQNIFGCSPEDVLDDFGPIGRVIYSEDAERVINDIEYSAEHLTYFTCEFRVQIPGREIQWIYSNSTPERLPDGSVTWYGFNVDITDRKQIELELLKAKAKAEESDRLKSAFLANMSHEIRTPMNGILGFSDLLKEPGLSSETQSEYVNIIEKSGARMLNIISEIMDISKIESGQMEISFQKTNINDRLKDAYILLKPEANSKKIDLSFKSNLSDEDAFTLTDVNKLYSILTNLVKNAIKYTDKGSIVFGCELKDDSFEFFVKDTGIGIPKDRQGAIFERFIQADIKDIQARQGAGLGLSISKAFVEMLGGRIWVESEVGEGSTFYFALPNQTASSKLVLDESTGSNPNPGIASTPFVPRLKILIAEDDETSEKFLFILTKDISREVLKATNGLKAVEMCRNNPDIDLILMDINMPVMGGYEATRQIRQFNRDVVIISQTAYGLLGDRETSIQAGCNDYISKPIKSKDLKVLIMKYFNK